MARTRTNTPSISTTADAVNAFLYGRTAILFPFQQYANALPLFTREYALGLHLMSDDPTQQPPEKDTSNKTWPLRPVSAIQDPRTAPQQYEDAHASYTTLRSHAWNPDYATPEKFPSYGDYSRAFQNLEKIKAIRDAAAGQEPTVAAYRQPEHFQSFADKQIPIEKMKAIAQATEDIRTGQMSMPAGTQQIRNIASGKTAEEGMWDLTPHAPNTQTREQRLAAVAAAQPQVNAYYAQAAKNASSFSGQTVTPEQYRTLMTKSLSDEQLRVVQSKAQVTLTTAGPGSGKTSTMMEQFADAVTSGQMKPEDMKFLGKTHSAVGAMKGKVEQGASRLMPKWEAGEKRDRQFQTMDSFTMSRLMKKDSEGKTVLSRLGNKMGVMNLSPLYEQMGETIGDDLAAKEKSDPAAYVARVMAMHGISTRDNNPKNMADFIMKTKGDRDEYRPLWDKGRSEFEAGGWDRQRQVNPEVVLYLYDQALRHRPGFQIAGQQGAKIDLADAPYMLRQAADKGLTHPLKGYMVDEYQDLSPEQARTLAALTGSQTRGFIGGDPSQPVMSQTAPIGRILSESLGKRAQSYTLTGNYRSGPINVAMTNAISRLRALSNLERAPQQVSMRPLGAYDAFPTQSVSSTLRGKYHQMTEDWMAHQQISPEIIAARLREGQHPFAGRNVSQSPFVFQMDEKGRGAFRSVLSERLSQAMSPEMVSHFFQHYYTEQTPEPGKREDQIHALMMSQIRSREGDKIYADIQRGGLWGPEDYQRLQYTILSRAREQNHLYTSTENFPNSTRYDLKPAHFMGQEVAPGYNVLSQAALTDAYHMQNYPLGFLSPDLQEELKASGGMNPQGGAGDSAATAAYAEDVIRLLKWYQPAVGQGSGLSDAQGDTSFTGFADDEDQRQNGFSPAARLNAAVMAGLYRKGGDYFTVEMLKDMALSTAQNGTQEPVPDFDQWLAQMEPMVRSQRVKHNDVWIGPDGKRVVTPYDPSTMYPAPTEGLGEHHINDPEGNRRYSEYSHYADPDAQVDDRSMRDRKYKGFDDTELEKMVQATASGVMDYHKGVREDVYRNNLTHPDVLEAVYKAARMDQGHPVMKRILTGLEHANIPLGQLQEQLSVARRAGNDTQVLEIESTLRRFEVQGKNTRKDRKRAANRAMLGEAGRAEVVRGILTPGSLFHNAQLASVVRAQLLDRYAGQAHDDQRINLLSGAASSLASQYAGRDDYADRVVEWKQQAEQLPAYGLRDAGPGVGLSVTHASLEQMRAMGDPEQARLLEQIAGREGTKGELLPLEHEEVSARINQLPYEMGKMNRFNMEDPKQIRHLAPALTALQTYFSGLQGGMEPGTPGNPGLFDPDAVAAIIAEKEDAGTRAAARENGQDEDFNFHALGAGVPLDALLRRRREQVYQGEMRKGFTTEEDGLPLVIPEQMAGYHKDIANLTQIKEQLGDPTNQLRYAHTLRTLMRATTGEDVGDRREDKDAYGKPLYPDPVRKFFSNRTNDFKEGGRTPDSILSMTSAFEEASAHLEQHGSLKYSHIERLLGALGHRPDDPQFKMLAGLKERGILRPTQENPDPSLSLDQLRAQAPSGGSAAAQEERKDWAESLTRVPFSSEHTYHFTGQDMNPDQRRARMRKGISGTLTSYAEGEPFGLSKSLAFYRKNKLFGDVGTKAQSNEQGNPDLAPMFQLNVKGGKQYPVRADQLTLGKQPAPRSENVVPPPRKGLFTEARHGAPGRYYPPFTRDRSRSKTPGYFPGYDWWVNSGGEGHTPHVPTREELDKAAQSVKSTMTKATRSSDRATSKWVTDWQRNYQENRGELKGRGGSPGISSWIDEKPVTERFGDTRARYDARVGQMKGKLSDAAFRFQKAMRYPKAPWRVEKSNPTSTKKTRWQAEDLETMKVWPAYQGRAGVPIPGLPTDPSYRAMADPNEAISYEQLRERRLREYASGLRPENVHEEYQQRIAEYGWLSSHQGVRAIADQPVPATSQEPVYGQGWEMRPEEVEAQRRAQDAAQQAQYAQRMAAKYALTEEGAPSVKEGKKARRKGAGKNKSKTALSDLPLVEPAPIAPTTAVPLPALSPSFDGGSAPTRGFSGPGAFLPLPEDMDAMMANAPAFPRQGGGSGAMAMMNASALNMSEWFPDPQEVVPPGPEIALHSMFGDLGEGGEGGAPLPDFLQYLDDAGIGTEAAVLPSLQDAGMVAPVEESIPLGEGESGGTGVEGEMPDFLRALGGSFGGMGVGQPPRPPSGGGTRPLPEEGPEFDRTLRPSPLDPSVGVASLAGKTYARPASFTPNPFTPGEQSIIEAQSLFNQSMPVPPPTQARPKRQQGVVAVAPPGLTRDTSSWLSRNFPTDAHPEPTPLPRSTPRPHGQRGVVALAPPGLTRDTSSWLSRVPPVALPGKRPGPVPPPTQQWLSPSMLSHIYRTRKQVDIEREGRSIRFHPLSANQQRVLDSQAYHTLIEGGPGSGKTDLVAKKMGDLISQRQVKPSRIVSLSAMHSGVQEFKKRIDENIRPFLSKRDQQALRDPVTIHRLAHQIVFPSGKPSPHLEDIGHSDVHSILANMSEEELAAMPEDERRLYKSSQSKFLRNAVNEHIEGAPLGEDALKQLLTHISTIKKSRGSQEDLYPEAMAEGQQFASEGRMHPNTALYAYENALPGSGYTDFEDLLPLAGQVLSGGGKNALPSSLHGTQLIANDEAQDLSHPVKQFIQSVMGAVGGSPRLLTGMDPQQSLLENLGAFPAEQVGEEHLGMMRATGLPMAHIRLDENFRSPRRDVAMANAIGTLGHMKGDKVEAIMQKAMSSQQGRDPQFLMTDSQPMLYDKMVRSMIGRTGVPLETIKANVAAGKHPFAGVDWEQEGLTKPGRIPFIGFRDQQVKLLEKVGPRALASLLGVSAERGSKAFGQIYRRGLPGRFNPEQQEEFAQGAHFRGLKVGQTRGLDFDAPHMDATKVGQWQKKENLPSFLRNLRIATSRVTPGGQNIVGASRYAYTNEQMRQAMTRPLPEDFTEESLLTFGREKNKHPERVRSDPSNAWGTYKGKQVPGIFGEILPMRDEQLAAWKKQGEEQVVAPVISPSVPAPTPLLTSPAPLSPSLSVGPAPMEAMEALPPNPHTSSLAPSDGEAFDAHMPADWGLSQMSPEHQAQVNASVMHGSLSKSERRYAAQFEPSPEERTRWAGAAAGEPKIPGVRPPLPDEMVKNAQNRAPRILAMLQKKTEMGELTPHDFQMHQAAASSAFEDFQHDPTNLHAYNAIVDHYGLQFAQQRVGKPVTPLPPELHQHARALGDANPEIRTMLRGIAPSPAKPAQGVSTIPIPVPPGVAPVQPSSSTNPATMSINLPPGGAISITGSQPQVNVSGDIVHRGNTPRAQGATPAPTLTEEEKAARKQKTTPSGLDPIRGVGVSAGGGSGGGRGRESTSESGDTEKDDEGKKKKGGAPPGYGGGFNNLPSNFGRSLTRIGDEIQFTEKTIDQLTNMAAAQGSEYRRATLSMAGSGNGTGGFFNFTNGGSGIRQLQNQLPGYSLTQLAQSMQQLSATTGVTTSPALTQGTQSLLGLSAISGVDPSQLIAQSSGIAGSIGQGQNMALPGQLGGMLTQMYGGTLSTANVTPTLSALQQILPSMQGTNLGGPSQMGSAMAVFSSALAGGMTTSNLPQVSSVVDQLTGIGTSPSLPQQAFLNKLFPNQLTAAPEYAQFQQSQASGAEQLAQLHLQQNIGGGLSLPRLQMQIANADIQMQRANLDMSELQLAYNQQQTPMQLQGQALNYQYGVASYNFNLAQQNAQYGPIGADVSRGSYFNFMRNQMAAGYNPLSAETGTQFAKTPTFGLQNEQFYAGVEHQRQDLVLSRSPLLSDALFQENQKYLNEQEAFYKQQLTLTNAQRSFEKDWQARLLAQQGKELALQEEWQPKLLAGQASVLAVQERQYGLAVLNNKYTQQQLAIQDKYLPIQAAALANVLSANAQQIGGQGPVNGQNVTPQQILTALAGIRDPSQLKQTIQMSRLSPADQSTLFTMIKGIQKEGGLDKVEHGQTKTDKALQAQINKFLKNGAFTDQIGTSTATDAALFFGGTGSSWKQFSQAFIDAKSQWVSIANSLSGMAPYLKDISNSLKIVGPALVILGTIFNGVGLGKAIAGTPIASAVGDGLGSVGGYITGGGLTSAIGGGLSTLGGGSAAAGLGAAGLIGAGFAGDIAGGLWGWNDSNKKTQGFDWGGILKQAIPFYGLGDVAGKTYHTLKGDNSNTQVQGQWNGIWDWLTGKPSSDSPKGFHSPPGVNYKHGGLAVTDPALAKKMAPPSDMWSNFVKGWNQFWSDRTKDWQGFVKGWDKWWADRTKDWQNFTKAWDKWWADRGKEWQNFTKVWNQFWTDRGKDWQNLMKFFTSWLGDRAHEFQNWIATAKTWLIDRGNDFKGWIAEAKTWLTDRGNDFKGMIAGWAKGFGDLVGKTIPDFFTKTLPKSLTDALSKALSKLNPFAMPTSGGGGGAGEAVVSHGGFVTPHVNTEFGVPMSYGFRHQGVDFAAAQGTPLSAFSSGIVTASSFQPWGGEIDMDIGGGLTERYLHLSMLGVTPGQKIRRGQRIGLTGGGTVASGLGKWSSGAHSHVQIDRGNILGGINPWPIWALMGDQNISSFYGGNTSYAPPNTGAPGAPRSSGETRGGGGGHTRASFAQGGVALGRTVATIAEQQPEVVLPLSRLSEVLNGLPQSTLASSSPHAASATHSVSTTPHKAVNIQNLVGSLTINVGSGGKMSESDQDELMSQMMEIFTAAATQLAGRLQ